MSRESLPVPRTRTIGPYHIRRRLGQGGMAETFLAVRVGTGGFERECCIKRMRPDRAAEPENLSRFEREVLVHAQLRHANIVTAEDAGVDPEHGHYLVLEYVRGVDLQKLLDYCAQSAPLPHDVAAYIAAQAAEGLHYVHELSVDGRPMGLIHRDLSAGNILLSEHGFVKVIDFGMVLHRDTIKVTKTDSIPGNIRFLSPEHFQRDRLTLRSDIFALGIVLYMMLTGEHPFSSSDEAHAGMLAGNANAALRDPAALGDAGVPGGLAQLVLDMLRRDPEERPETAERVAERLDPFFRQYSARVRLSLIVQEAQRAAEEGEAAERSAANASSAVTSALAAQPPKIQTAAPRFAKRRTAALVVAVSGAALLGSSIYITSSSAGSPSEAGRVVKDPDGVTGNAGAPAAAKLAVAAPLPDATQRSETERARRDSVEEDAGLHLETPPPDPQLPETTTLHVSIAAGCIFLDGKSRGEHDVRVGGLKPGKHVIGFAPTCQTDVDESHSVQLTPGAGTKHVKYPYIKGLDFQ